MHTPGPWKADSLLISAGREIIAHVGGTLGAGPRLGEQLDNAYLIAAAPLLLAGCRKALEWLAEAGDTSGELGQVLRLAIAEADPHSLEAAYPPEEVHKAE